MWFSSSVRARVRLCFPHPTRSYSHSDRHTDTIGGPNLFFLPYAPWRALRAKLTPFFTAAKLRQMFHLMSDIGATLDRVLGQMTAANGGAAETEVRDRMSRYTIQVVASCAFGIAANCLTDSACRFRECGRLIFDFTYRRAVELTSMFFMPEWVPVFRFKVRSVRVCVSAIRCWCIQLSPRFVQLFTAESGDFLRQSINQAIGERERSGHRRNDLIDTLIELKNSDTTEVGEMRYEGDVLVAQAAIFFSAGYETSSSTMTFALYELAKHVGRCRTGVH